MTGPDERAHEDAPRLPDALPVHEPAAVAPEQVPTVDLSAPTTGGQPAPRGSDSPVGFFVVLLFIVVGLVAILAVARPWEGAASQPETTVEPPSASSTTATAPTTSPAPTTTVAATTIATTTTIVVELPRASIAFDRSATEALFAQVEECRTEQRIVFVSLQAFVNQTGAHPSHPDRLAASGWLEEHPDGWSPRWAFDYSEAGITVVPTPGGACDL